MPGLHFEEFETGRTYRHAATRSVTDFDNIWYSCISLNTQPLHLNFDFAQREGLHKKLLFNSLYTLSIVIGQTGVDLTRGTLKRNIVLTDIELPRSVFHGDTLYSRTRIGALEDVPDHPDAGSVELFHEGWNQDDELVASCTRRVLIYRRGCGASAAA